MDRVIVLMSTYNGEKYLRNQIESLLQQVDAEIEILVRDDGSKDGTLGILEEYKNSPEHRGKLSYYVGANVGPAKSFLDLMKHAPEAEFYALCDQDDTWLPDKLKIAVEAIRKGALQNEKNLYRNKNKDINKNIIKTGNRNDSRTEGPEGCLESECRSGKTLDWKNDGTETNERNCITNDSSTFADRNAGCSLGEVPVLYYGMPRFADNDGNLLKGPKGIYEKSLDFPACLIKSNSTGCTMVFNRRLLDIVNEKTPGDITMHDEWLHKVCLGLGGHVIYDEDVHILYRQHGGNTIGGQLSGKKVLKRYINTFMEADCIRSRCIRTLIDCYGDRMPERNLELALEVSGYKNSLSDRLRLIFDNRIKTGYFKRDIMFKLSVLLGAF